MNIFAIESTPDQSAKSMVDRHVVKMIVESAQLLSTAHRILDGHHVDCVNKNSRKTKIWLLTDDREFYLYKATHVNHPSSVWCRENINNYNWLYCHFDALLNEYTYRYGKVHKCSIMRTWLQMSPFNIPHAPLTPVTPAMPDEYKIEHDSLSSYRNYYAKAKTKLHKWTNREPPVWIQNFF